MSPPATGRVDYWDSSFSADTTLPGSFGLRVFATGVKSWQVMYRVSQRGRSVQKRLSLGAYPAFSLAEARQWAREALIKVARGVDPAEERKHEEARAASIPNVREAATDFINTYAPTRNKSWHETARIFERYVYPAWGERPLPSVTKKDILDLLNEVHGRAPYMANRILAALRRFGNWCVEHGKLEISPAQGVNPPAREQSRDRVLTDDEAAAIWKACDQMGFPFGPLLQLLLVTGQREVEVARMQWSNVDVESRTWTVPATVSKNRMLNEVPLSDLALGIIGKLPRGSDLVFSTTGSTSVSGFSKAKRRCDELSGVTGWRIHDLRRTVSSSMARLRIQPWIIEKVLNHQDGQLSGVAGIYNRWGYQGEKKEALEQWANHLKSVLANQSRSTPSDPSE